MITRWALKSLITSKLFAGITKPLEETLGIFFLLCTDKSLSEALIFASSNQQYDNRLFIVHGNCKLRITAEHVVYRNCF